MLHKVTNAVLLATITVGAVLAWRTGEERSRLASEYARLRAITGDFPIGDPSKVHVLALDTGEERSYAWRVHFPANYKRIIRDGGGSGSTSWASSPVDDLARLRIRENQQGQLEYYTRFPGTSGRMSLGDTSLADFLRGRWGQLRVEQLGVGELAVIAPGKPATLLRLSMPDAMADEARKTLTPSDVARYVPTVIELNVGPKSEKP
jgi:hypothetical protein